MNKIRKAWKVAERIHNHQYRFNGQPYTNHLKDCVRIYDEMSIEGIFVEVLIILHDVLEDGGKSSDVDFLTKSEYDSLLLLKHEGGLATYESYIDNICESGNKDVIIVKIVDMIQNLTEDPKKKQRDKYRKALPKLMRSLLQIPRSEDM